WIRQHYKLDIFCHHALREKHDFIRFAGKNGSPLFFTELVFRAYSLRQWKDQGLRFSVVFPNELGEPQTRKIHGFRMHAAPYSDWLKFVQVYIGDTYLGNLNPAEERGFLAIPGVDLRALYRPPYTLEVRLAEPIDAKSISFSGNPNPFVYEYTYPASLRTDDVTKVRYWKHSWPTQVLSHGLRADFGPACHTPSDSTWQPHVADFLPTAQSCVQKAGQLGGMVFEVWPRTAFHGFDPASTRHDLTGAACCSVYKFAVLGSGTPTNSGIMYTIVNEEGRVTLRGLEVFYDPNPLEEFALDANHEGRFVKSSGDYFLAAESGGLQVDNKRWESFTGTELSPWVMFVLPERRRVSRVELYTKNSCDKRLFDHDSGCDFTYDPTIEMTSGLRVGVSNRPCVGGSQGFGCYAYSYEEQTGFVRDLDAYSIRGAPQTLSKSNPNYFGIQPCRVAGTQNEMISYADYATAKTNQLSGQVLLEAHCAGAEGRFLFIEWAPMQQLSNPHREKFDHRMRRANALSQVKVYTYAGETGGEGLTATTSYPLRNVNAGLSVTHPSYQRTTTCAKACPCGAELHSACTGASTTVDGGLSADLMHTLQNVQNPAVAEKGHLSLSPDMPLLRLPRLKHVLSLLVSW
ncbi:unnamed protein product, partial [Amoebophrya sp. A25]